MGYYKVVSIRILISGPTLSYLLMEAAAGGRGFSGIMVNEEGFAIENVILARFKTPTEIQGIGIDIRGEAKQGL